MSVANYENVFSGITFFIFLLLIATPFWVAKKQNTLHYFKLLSKVLLITFFLFTIFCFWSESLSITIIYRIFGFDENGMNDLERFTKPISSEDKTAINAIYDGSFGIGWPLQLILMYILVVIPYNAAICGLIYTYNKYIKK